MKQLPVFQYLSDKPALGFVPTHHGADLVVPFLHQTKLGFQAALECHAEGREPWVILDQGPPEQCFVELYERAVRMAHQIPRDSGGVELAQIIPFPPQA